MHNSWARLASFCHWGFISDHLIVSKFHNKTHDPKGQENKIYTIVKGRETFYRRHTVPVTSCSKVKYILTVKYEVWTVTFWSVYSELFSTKCEVKCEVWSVMSELWSVNRRVWSYGVWNMNGEVWSELCSMNGEVWRVKSALWNDTFCCPNNAIWRRNNLKCDVGTVKFEVTTGLS